MRRGAGRTLPLALAIAAVAGAIGGGLWMLGSPAAERVLQEDRRRTADLQRLQLATDLYWTRNNRLPVTLEELARESGTNVYSRDPVSGQPYEYSVNAPGRYELCALFSQPAPEPREGFWSHAVGRHCFGVTARTIRP